uniref:Chloride channel CLIC-like protein 1 n=1 Tax=Tetranychus urticae TaxID=32264 RepID=T1L1D0_TETUR
MRYCLVNCLYITVVCQFVFAFLVSAKESGNPQESDLDDSEKLLYKSLDKSDWVDYGDMFTYDPATKTNREPKLKTAVEMVIKRKKEAQQNADQFESNCDAVEQKLRECEAKKRLTYDCARNDHCGKLSYLIVRRLIMKLSKLIDSRYYSGSTIGLNVNLDDYFFDLPFDFSNLTDCDYLVQINPLIDRLISSVVITIPKSNNVVNTDLYKYGTTAIGIILVVLWFGLKMSTQTRLYAILFSFMSVVYIVEYNSLFETHKAHSQETIDRLKSKCTQQDDQDWSGWLKSMLPVMSFKSSKNECQDYYSAFIEIAPE